MAANGHCGWSCSVPLPLPFCSLLRQTLTVSTDSNHRMPLWLSWTTSQHFIQGLIQSTIQHPDSWVFGTHGPPSTQATSTIINLHSIYKIAFPFPGCPWWAASPARMQLETRQMSHLFHPPASSSSIVANLSRSTRESTAREAKYFVEGNLTNTEPDSELLCICQGWTWVHCQ